MLDEGVPRRLASALRQFGHDVSTFPSSWKGLRNRQLLSRLEADGFALLLTCDKSFRFQQTVSRRSVGLVVLPAQRFEDLVPFLGAISEALQASRPGETVVLPVSRKT